MCFLKNIDSNIWRKALRLLGFNQSIIDTRLVGNVLGIELKEALQILFGDLNAVFYGRVATRIRAADFVCDALQNVVAVGRVVSGGLDERAARGLHGRVGEASA